MSSARSERSDGDEVAKRLGLTFDDTALLARAVTHPSWAAEHGGPHYERLEFLGDSVLGFIVADLLHEQYPDRAEGDLTRMKIALVRGETLTDLALEFGLDRVVRLGRGAERSGDRVRPSVLEAVFEAVVGAVYLDGGIEGAREFVRCAMGSRVAEAAHTGRTGDPKTLLQEYTQAAGMGLPSYEIVQVSGPDQERTFTAEVSVEGRLRGRGSGRSKQAAQASAAARAMEDISGVA